MDAPPPRAEPPYPRSVPPAVLYHAVPASAVEAALRQGLAPTGRPHVHLARSPAHALSALRPEVDPVALAVDAAALHAAGTPFWCSPKAVWLCERVPPTAVRRA